MSEPESHVSTSVSRSLPDPNPDPCSNTMKKRRWRARKRGEHVPTGAYYPALTRAGRPRKGMPRPAFELDQTAQKTNGPGDQPGPLPLDPILNPGQEGESA